jgi:hypothetical protein
MFQGRGIELRISSLGNLQLKLAEAAAKSLRFETVGMGPSAYRSLVGISLQIVSTLDPHGFVHEHLDGLGHGFEAVLEKATGQLPGWCSIGTGVSWVWSPFSVVTKKKPILAHFFKQTDRPSSVLVHSLRSRTRTELESDEFT